VKYINPLVPKKFEKINNKGYVLVWNGKWELQHKLVVEDYLGRKLSSNEVIHHINGIRNDNRIDNLMIFNSQREHKAFENKIRQFGITTPIKLFIEKRWEGTL
jgi:hypothetical protein